MVGVLSRGPTHRAQVQESDGAAETHRLQDRHREQPGAPDSRAGVREPVQSLPDRALLSAHPTRLLTLPLRGAFRKRGSRGNRQGEGAGQAGVRTGQERRQTGGTGQPGRQQQGHPQPGDRQHPSAH